MALSPPAVNTAGIETNSIIAPQRPYAGTGIAVSAEVAWQLPTLAVIVVPIADNTKGMRLTSVYAINRAALGGITNVALYRLVGTTYTLIKAIAMADNTPTLAVANGNGDFGYTPTSPLTLLAGEGLAFSIGRAVANGVVCRAEGGAYV